MNILIIGSGGREHTLVWKIAQSPRVKKIYCAPGNGGISLIAECVPVKVTDVPALVNFAREKKIDLTVVGPEVPLAAGIVDEFGKENLKVFGPTKIAAELESSKVFAKKMMRKYGIPTGEGEIFARPQEAIAYIREKGAPLVVKADGLAAGKGVIVCPTVKEAEEAINLIMVEKAFGEAGSQVIVEECLQGEEASFIALTDGETILLLIPSQDHKPIYDGDKGPNTGGMGAYSPAPVVTDDVDRKIRERVIKPLLARMKEDGMPFTGFLYAGLMIKDGEPHVLEFNVRCGDPETQPIMTRYGGDLLDLLEAAADGDMGGVDVSWKDDASVCVVMASGGYPGNYEKGHEITGLGDCAGDVVVFHAGTKLDGARVVTTGGRGLGVTATAPTLKEAVDAAYACCAKIRWKDCFYRKDIAKRAVDRK